MTFKTVDDINFDGKRALIRVDFNVPLDKSGKITDDYRIRSALPTIKKVVDDGGLAILMSHLGRPSGKVDPELSLVPVYKHLQEILDCPVEFADDCVGTIAENFANNLEPGSVLLLENLRFHTEEKANDPGFSKDLAKLADVYVNDAFGTAHRAHASTVGVTEYFDEKVAGYLIQKEVEFMVDGLENPDSPYIAIMGGAKISGKIDLIDKLLNSVDSLLVGGGMAYTFLKAKGIEIGGSLLEEGKLDVAKDVLARVEKENLDFLLPSDCIAATHPEEGIPTSTLAVDHIAEHEMGLDIGPQTIETFTEKILNAKTILWNGPMGVFEVPEFVEGTQAIAGALAEATEKGATTIIGGGDSASAIRQFNLMDKVSHVSTGGGASLELLSGNKLPGIEALKN
ncbi:MAG: phosphoglycerate kinase [Candidatus Marinimicrobia bacterium]|nr:phosphoglycerate kinase [Candidatus Neomarinimicrobiota bacterium]MCF7880273.1 phosphoglycerate kinase [Candidatus Neomarinimicrobiota bacterium]